MMMKGKCRRLIRAVQNYKQNFGFILTLPIKGDEMYLCIKPLEEDRVVSANIREMVRKRRNIEIKTISSRF